MEEIVEQSPYTQGNSYVPFKYRRPRILTSELLGKVDDEESFDPIQAAKSS